MELLTSLMSYLSFVLFTFVCLSFVTLPIWILYIDRVVEIFKSIPNIINSIGEVFRGLITINKHYHYGNEDNDCSLEFKETTTWIKDNPEKAPIDDSQKKSGLGKPKEKQKEKQKEKPKK